GRWPRLRLMELIDCGLNDLALRGLMRQGAFPSLECLSLDGDLHAPALRALLLSGALPRLRILGLSAGTVTLDELQALRAEFEHRVEIGTPVRRRHGATEAEPT